MLIPLKAGQIEIPEVSVAWFDTITKKAEKASVPARPLVVEQGEIAPVIGPTTKPEEPIPAVENKPVQEQNTPQNTWIWVIGGVLLGLVTGGLLVFFWHLHKTHSKGKKEKPLPDFYPFK